MTTADPPLGVHPRQARGIEKRRLVYEAALRAYARDGVRRARIEDIVADAGVGWGTFFNYFPRKEDVLLTAALDVQAAMETSIEASRARGSAAAETIADAYRHFSAPPSSPRLQGAIARELLASGDRYEEMVNEAGRQPLWRTLAEVLRAGQQDGTVRDDVDAALLARLLNSSMLAMHARLGGRGDIGLPPTDIEALTSTSLRVVWEGIGRTTT